MTGKSKY